MSKGVRKGASTTVMFIGILVVCITIFTLQTFLFSDDTWVSIVDKDTGTREEEDQDTERKSRQQRRGFITSVIVASIANVGGIILLKLGADESSTYAMFSVLWTNIIGYISDYIIATDEGLHSLQTRGLRETMKDVFSYVNSKRFYKYMLTICLDLCIGSFLMDRILSEIHKMPLQLGSQAPFVVSSVVVGNIMFFAYSNYLRVNWALIPSSQGTVDDGLISLVGTAIGAIYLMQQPKPNSMIESSMGRLVVVITIMLLASIILTSSEDKGSYIIGLLTYVGISILVAYVLSKNNKDQNLLFGALSALFCLPTVPSIIG